MKKNEREMEWRFALQAAVRAPFSHTPYMYATQDEKDRARKENEEGWIQARIADLRKGVIP